MCMEPPRALQSPVDLPRSSAIISGIRVPLAMECPWPRWVVRMASSSSSAVQTPTEHASCPMLTCTAPFTRPAMKNSSVFSSKRRMRNMLRYIAFRSFFVNLFGFADLLFFALVATASSSRR